MGLTQVDLVTSTEAPEVVRTRDAQAPCHLEGIEHRTGFGRRAPDAEVLGPEHREIEGTDVVTDDDPAIEGLVEGIGMLDEPPCTSNIRIEDAMDAGGPSRDAHTGIDERAEVDGFSGCVRSDHGILHDPIPTGRDARGLEVEGDHIASLQGVNRHGVPFTGAPR